MQRGVALVSVRALEYVLDCFRVEELQEFGLVDGAFDLRGAGGWRRGRAVCARRSCRPWRRSCGCLGGGAWCWCGRRCPFVRVLGVAVRSRRSWGGWCVVGRADLPPIGVTTRHRGRRRARRRCSTPLGSGAHGRRRIRRRARGAAGRSRRGSERREHQAPAAQAATAPRRRAAPSPAPRSPAPGRCAAEYGNLIAVFRQTPPWNGWWRETCAETARVLRGTRSVV
jgi:hypothetical protein